MPLGVVVQSYVYKSDANESDETLPYSLIDPLEWPSGSFLMSILEKEHQLDALLQSDARYNDQRFWQALARRALLQKFGRMSSYLPIVASETMEATTLPRCDTLRESNNEIELIRSSWTELIRDHTSKTHGSQSDEATRQDDVTFDDDMMESNRCGGDDLLEFLSSRCATSNRRWMQWSFMTIPAGLRFPLHAHPNIELVYCCTGALHEIRMDGPPVPHNSMRPQAQDDGNSVAATSDDTDPLLKAPKLVGPSMTNVQRPWTFGTLSAGQWLVNEVGSIHQSFTATNARTPCRLLVLWGGSHADIVHPPTSVDVTDAVHTMDQRLGTCASCDGTTDYTVIAETFLPASERKSIASNVPSTNDLY